MATIEKRANPAGGNSYRVKVRLKGFPNQTETFKRLTDAKRWAVQVEASIREGKYFNTSESKKRTLADAIDKYAAECLPQLKDPIHRIHHLKWWKKQLGHSTLSHLNRAAIVECRNDLKKIYSEATVNRYLASLSPVCSEAVKEWGWMSSNPCLNVRRYKEPDGRTRFLSDDERNRLLDACDKLPNHPEMRVIILVAITTGIRRGDIRGLRWKHVDFKRQRLIIENPKNGETRSVPLVSLAYDEMTKWAKVRSLNNDSYVFAGKTKATEGQPLDFDACWQKLRKLAELSDFRFHDLRHTAASYLAMNGAGLREIGDILGHKTLAMVQRYSHLTEDHKNATVTKMTNSVFGVK
jgi:integrase|tara:strand:- start:346 stop:1401 length:1056 start_codon:yes stop_codon:yes gene_type:complete